MTNREYRTESLFMAGGAVVLNSPFVWSAEDLVKQSSPKSKKESKFLNATGGALNLEVVVQRPPFDSTAKVNLSSNYRELKRLIEEMLRSLRTEELLVKGIAGRGDSPTLGQVAQHLFRKISKGHFEVIGDLYSVQVSKSPLEWCEYFGKTQQWVWTRSFGLNCVHRHHNSQLSNLENKRLFKKCSKVHGHEYQIEVSLMVESLPEVGYFDNILQMGEIIQREVIDLYDKQYLNEFMGNSSGEAIIEFFYDRLRDQFSHSHLEKIRLRETRKNSFVLYGRECKREEYAQSDCAGLI